MLDLMRKKILIVGLGSSGYACARFLAERGASVTVTDQAREQHLQMNIEELRQKGVSLELGGHSITTAEQSNLIVISPGVPDTIPLIQAARTKKIPVWGEIELACRWIQSPMVAITGTNGKTTVTRLISAMLEKSGFSVFTGGNIGTPLIEYVERNTTADRVVIEVSSFQLDTIETFRPHVSVLLNITEDHLDRYDGFEAYARSKARIFQNQEAGDYAVLNGADSNIRRLAGKSRATNLFFNPVQETETAALINCESVRFSGIGPDGEASLDLTQTSLVGKHNRENIAAASLAALAAGGSLSGIQAALKAFKGLPHRLEYVDTIDQIHFYDDSKATNVDAVLRALESIDGKIILIMGGLDKGGEYQVLKDLLQEKVRLIVVMGAAREIIKKALGPYSEVEAVASMEAAVGRAYERARPDDTVLLSPACASFDMFTGYAHRGDVFCRAVKALLEKQA